MASTAAASLSTLAIGAAPVKPAGDEEADHRGQRQRPADRREGDGAGQEAGTTRSTRRSREWRSSRPIPRTIRSATAVCPTKTASSSSTPPSCTGRPTAAARWPRSATSCTRRPSPGWSCSARRHCLLVGEGALRFARAHGFPEVNLLTDEARQIWLHWKETRDPKDDWLPPPDEKVAAFIRESLANRGHRHDPLLGARHARRPGLHDHDLGPVVEDPRPRRRFADPGRRVVSSTTRSARPARPASAS